jgi:acyl-CoA synthetase (AMP-forming)/AMP-acid ligase II
LLPCYGLAEATLLVASSPATTTPVVTEIDSRRFVSCGAPPEGVSIVIVEPETRTRLDDGSVGEIWIRGPGVADGYWGDPTETQAAFAARLADGGGPYLRSGDLGFLRDGQLFVTGRLKERIVVRGRTLYPQDVEATVEAADASVRPGRVAAFSIEDNGDERLVVTCEVSRRSKQPAEDVVEAIRGAVAREHGVAPHAIVLLEPGVLPRTTSGKPRRVESRARYLASVTHRSSASE